MRLLFSNSTTRPARPAASHLAERVLHLVPPHLRHLVGDFIQPRSRQQLGQTEVWAADNDAFSGFDPDRFRRMLDTMLRGIVGRGGLRAPKFVTVPDVVGDHHATRDLFDQWSAEVGGRGFDRAFVLQNGIEADLERNGWNALPENAEAYFIGGDTAFKFSPAVAEITRHANRLGQWVHMGRVNSIKRMEYACAIGCDSCDGSGMARFPDAVLLPMLRALSAGQMFLF